MSGFVAYVSSWFTSESKTIKNEFKENVIQNMKKVLNKIENNSKEKNMIKMNSVLVELLETPRKTYVVIEESRNFRNIRPLQSSSLRLPQRGSRISAKLSIIDVRRIRNNSFDSYLKQVSYKSKIPIYKQPKPRNLFFKK